MCVATITTGPGKKLIPPLSDALPLWVTLLAAALAALGVAALTLAALRGRTVGRERRRGRSGQHGAASAGIGLLAAGALLLIGGGGTLAQRAEALPVTSADRIETRYGSGCTLFAIDRIEPIDRAAPLVPGDESPLLRMDVANRYALPVTVTARAELIPVARDARPLPAVARFADSGSGPAIIEARSETVLHVAAAVPGSLGNEAQGQEYRLSVVITAEGRRDQRG